MIESARDQSVAFRRSQKRFGSAMRANYPDRDPRFLDRKRRHDLIERIDREVLAVERERLTSPEPGQDLKSFVKQLGPLLGSLTIYLGAAILGDGRIVGGAGRVAA